MIAYHIDRSGRLSTGATIDFVEYPQADNSFSFMASTLFNNKVSMHGYQYLSDSAANNIPHTKESIIEFETELVRRAFFPDMPSRFRSVFGIETPEDFLSWASIFSNPGFRIFKIEFDDSKYQKLDASDLPSGFLNMDNMHYSPTLNFQQAYNYWSGSSKEFYRQPELLITPPVSILEEVHLSIPLK